MAIAPTAPPHLPLPFPSHHRSLLLALAVILATPLHATPPDPLDLTTRTTWRVADGLPENTVQSIQQTSSGFLWVGTTGGAMRFDGAHFTPVPAAEGSIFSLLGARDGTLWLGTEGSGLLRLRHGTTETISAAEGLTDGFVRAILEDRTGRIWVGTDNGLFWIEGDRAHQVDTARFAAPLSVHALMEDARGRIWVGGSKLLVFQPSPTRGPAAPVAMEATQSTLPEAFSENRVKCILQSADRSIWIGTVGGLDHLVNGRFIRVPGITGTVRTLRETTDGLLWVGTIGHGLYVRRPGQSSATFVRFAPPGQPRVTTVLSLFEDDSQQLWVGSQDGLLRLRHNPVRIVPLPEDTAPDFATLSNDRGGALWVVSSRAYHVDHGTAVPATFPGLAGVTIRNIFRDRSGTLWFGTDGSGVYHQTSTGPQHFLAPSRLVNNFVRAFLESSAGDIWVATDEGVSRIRGDQVENLRMSDGLAYFSTRSLLEDRGGSIWIGTERGLSCWGHGHFVSNALTAALAREKVWSMLQTRDGVLWFGTRDHGLFRSTAAGIEHFTVAQGLTGDSIYQLLEDATGRIWLSGPAGISSFLPDQDTSLNGRLKQLATTVYDLPTSDEGTQMYGGRQPSGALTADGTVWFPSNRGAVEVLAEPQKDRIPPRVLITGIAVNGRPLDPASPELDLPPSQSRLEIAFAPLLLRPQAGVRIRYQLGGFDPGWIDAGSARSAYYTSLPAGRYRFQVAVFEADQPARVSEASVPLRIRPRFYKTPPFVGTCLAAFALLAWAIYKLRVRQIRLRFRAVIEERNRLAREMHDTVIQGCTGISALLEAMSSLGPANATLRESMLDHARTQVRATIDEARQAVWDLRHKDHLCIDLVDRIRQLAAQVQQDYTTEVTCQLRGTDRPISDLAARELLMVVREAVYNAALHGGPEDVAIVIESLPEGLLLEVRDNGSGFALDPHPDAEGKTLHYGIAGMRERVERLKGEFHLTSEPGKGTVMQARLRWSALLPHAAPAPGL